MIALYKKGDLPCTRNYRRISILANFAKIFKTILHAIILKNCCPMFSAVQYGFLSKRSIEINLCCIAQKIAEVIDSRKQMDVIYFDFTRAFERRFVSLIIFV